MFSKACEYGIKASLYVALNSQQNVRVSLTEIAREINSPKAFTAKVLQKLNHANIVNSVKGQMGGFEISSERIANIMLRDIVLAIDGDSIYVNCALGFKICDSSKPCPIHTQFHPIRSELKNMLETTTLLSLLNDLTNNNTFLKS
jgi:Rrf2 family iron-sulfur cluster assembly transcriptional regulator